MPLDEIAADWRQANQRAYGGIITGRGRAGAVIPQETRPSVLSWTGKNHVRMGGGLLGKRGDVKSAQSDENAAISVGVGDFIGAPCAGNVDLNDDEIGVIVEA